MGYNLTKNVLEREKISILFIFAMEAITLCNQSHKIDGCNALLMQTLPLVPGCAEVWISVIGTVGVNGLQV